MRNVRRIVLASSALYLVAAMPAWAQAGGGVGEQEAARSDQEGAAGTDDKQTSREIVVTGTLIRGVAPPGTNVVSLSQEDIVATGASSTSEVLQRVTQIGNFNNAFQSQVSNNGAALNTVSPDLRGLNGGGGTGGSGASNTLTLVDGHRVVGAGILQTVPDPNIVPPGVTERVEIVPDGGSSLYGADAVGGVINLITRRRIDGVDANARYGFADDYHVFDVDMTAGKTWQTGSAYVSYAYSSHDALFGRDRDWVRQIVPSNSCAPGTVTINSNPFFPFFGPPPVITTYRLPDRTPGTVATCDPTDNASLVPEEKRHSVFAGISQDFGAARFDMRGFYTNRVTHGYIDQLSATATIGRANPFFQAIGAEAQQSVAFSFSPVFGPSARNDTELSTWGVTPTLSLDVGGNWQVRAMANFGGSTTEAHQSQVNQATLAAAAAGTTTATALNPYVVSQTNPAVLAAIRDAEDFGLSRQRLYNGRIVAEGALFGIPGGDIKAAVGAEFIRETFATQRGVVTYNAEATAPKAFGARNVKAVFGELNVPLVGEGNGRPGLESLVLSASGRYDSYSDFGDTFNPKIGLTYKPLDWISLRANWAKSFTAPSLADTTGSVDTRLQYIPIVVVGRPGDVTAGQSMLIVAGGNPNLGPQRAKIYSLGADINPAAGLKLSVTYWNTDLKDQIATPAFTLFTNPTLFYSAYANFYKLSPSQTYVQDFVNANNISVIQGAASVPAMFAAGQPPVYQLVDLRRANVGRVKIDGLDFQASYFSTTSFGSVNAAFGGTYNLGFKTSSIGTAFFDALPGTSRLRLSGSIGATAGNFRTSLNWTHSHGYDVNPVSFGGQTHVSSFNLFDLFLSYDVKGQGVFEGLSFTLNVNNLFDQDPPFANIGSGYANGSTLGRMVQVGLRKKF